MASLFLVGYQIAGPPALLAIGKHDRPGGAGPAIEWCLVLEEPAFLVARRALWTRSVTDSSIQDVVKKLESVAMRAGLVALGKAIHARPGLLKTPLTPTKVGV